MPGVWVCVASITKTEQEQQQPRRRRRKTERTETRLKTREIGARRTISHTHTHTYAHTHNSPSLSFPQPLSLSLPLCLSQSLSFLICSPRGGTNRTSAIYRAVTIAQPNVDVQQGLIQFSIQQNQLTRANNTILINHEQANGSPHQRAVLSTPGSGFSSTP